MGRGGEKTATPPPQKPLDVDRLVGKQPLVDAAATVSSTVRPSKAVEAMPTEELRKKALQYGHDATADRATLLRELVSLARVGVVRWMSTGIMLDQRSLRTTSSHYPNFEH